MSFSDDTEEYNTTDWLPENGLEEWGVTIEWVVNSNGKIINGVNHCYSIVNIMNETIYANNDFPCPYYSNDYGNLTNNDALPFVGGGSDSLEGTVAIRQFEWLKQCDSSTICDESSFCNFDNTISGFCESCEGLEGDQDCDTAGFITEEGTTECKNVCLPGKWVWN